LDYRIRQARSRIYISDKRADINQVIGRYITRL